MGQVLRSLLIALLLLPFVAVAGCNSPQSTAQQQAGDNASEEELQVLATFLPMYLFTKAVAGEAAQVEILIPPGTEVHDYQSTPADVQAIAEADVLVKNGLEMEEFLDSTIDNAENSDLAVIDASANIQPLEETAPVVNPVASSGEDAHAHDGDEHAHEDDAHADEHAEDEVGSGVHVHAENPHVWLDPVLAIQQVETIRDGLIEADPANADTYQTNAAAYIEELRSLDQEFQTRLSAFSDRTFISFHDAFPYLANRYDLKQVAIVAIPEDNLSPNDIQNVVETVKDYDVKALFGEPGVDNKLLQSLSQDLNLTLSTLDPMESGELDPQYYFTAMNQNLEALEAAFK